eukprot:1143220-Pelagomonas_calceolata.AAC.2
MVTMVAVGGCGWPQPARNKSISLDTLVVEGTHSSSESMKRDEKQLENPLDSANKVASQRTPGRKVQTACDT